MVSAENRERSSNRLIACFRPVAIRNYPVEPDGSGDPVVAYFSVRRREEEMALPKIMKCLSGVKRHKVSSGGGVGPGDGGGRRSKERRSRSLFRILKGALFETSLAKKISRKKVQQNSYASKDNKIFANNLPTNKEFSEANNLKKNYDHPNHWSSLNISSSTTASTSLRSSSSSSVISISSSLRQNQPVELMQTRKRSSQMKVKKNCIVNSGFCLLLVCLLIVTCWGKVCAIFCTSTFLVLVPTRVNRVDPVGCGRVDSLEIDLREQKKRVIMEGLLARNRSHVQLYGH